jgi:hypothetical protein
VTGSDAQFLPTPAQIVNAMHRALTPELIKVNTFATLALYRFDLDAATNIIRHALLLIGDATITCRITREDEALTVELIYPSEAFSPLANLQPDFSGVSEGGFGLSIIEQSVDTVEYGSPMPGISSVRMLKRASAVAAC